MPGLVIMLGALLATVGCDQPWNGGSAIELDASAGMSGFMMADHLAATIVKSTDTSEVGRKLTFVNVNTDAPMVVFETGLQSPLKKVHEDNTSMTLVLVGSGTGSVDAFVIDKTTGLFARGTATAASTAAGIRAHAAVGSLK